MRMVDFQIVHGSSMAYRLCTQQARRHTEGVLPYVVYEGCWCRERNLCDSAQPWLLRTLVRGMESTKWRLVESSNLETHRFGQTYAIGGAWDRQHVVAAVLPAVASKFCIKMAQDAVAVRTSAFYAVPFFERVPFLRNCLGEPPSRQSVAFFLQECGSQQHATAIDARAARNKGLPASWRHSRALHYSRVD